jgi:hypothetical protein
VLKQKRPNTDVLIVDASKGFIKVGKNNKLRASDIKKCVDAIIHRENLPKYAKLVSREEIRANDYNLNIPRYVDSSENAESWDIYATMFGGIPTNEIDELYPFWQAFLVCEKPCLWQRQAIMPNSILLKSKRKLPNILMLRRLLKISMRRLPTSIRF